MYIHTCMLSKSLLKLANSFLFLSKTLYLYSYLILSSVLILSSSENIQGSVPVFYKQFVLLIEISSVYNFSKKIHAVLFSVRIVTTLRVFFYVIVVMLICMYVFQLHSNSIIAKILFDFIPFFFSTIKWTLWLHVSCLKYQFDKSIGGHICDISTFYGCFVILLLRR